MLPYRVRDKIFLRNREEQYLVYDGSHGTPDRFYMSSERAKKIGDLINNFEIRYLIITMPGLILVNVGTINQIKEGIWYAHHTERQDQPIDFIHLCSREGNSISFKIRFLYSDLSLTFIKFNKNKFRTTLSTITQGNEIITLPLTSLHTHKKDNVRLTFKDANNRIYSLTIVETYFDARLRSSLVNGIGSDCTEIILMNSYLNSNNDLICGAATLGDVLKVKHDVVLRTNRMLDFFEVKNGIISTENIADNVDNFYAHAHNGTITYYFIRGDQLFSMNNISKSKSLLMGIGASEIKFPTESHYDAQLTSIPGRVKSAYKR